MKLFQFCCLSTLLCQHVATAAKLSTRLYGVNYSLRQGPDWDPNKCKSPALADKELQQLKDEVTDNIRIYSMTDCDSAAVVLPLSQQPYRGELTAQEATDYRNTIYRNTIKSDLEAAGLTNIPVTIADIVDNFQDYPELIQVDELAVTMNHFGFFSPKTDLNGAAAYLETQYAMVEEQAQGRQIIVSETGWPGAGVIDSSSSVASSTGMAKYLRDFVCMANRRNWQYFWFTSYDSDWRRVQEGNPDSVEGHFGLFTQEGVLKPYLADLQFNCTDSSVDVDLSAIVPVETDEREPLESGAMHCLSRGLLWLCGAAMLLAAL